MTNKPESKNKNEKLYIEIQFPRNTSQTLKKGAPEFHLKRDYKNLESPEYAANLSQYLDQSRSITNFRMGGKCLSLNRPK